MEHKILCIDDESHNLEALERLLRKSYQVVTSISGKDALKELEQNQFSLIISDQKMPEMTGVQFFEEAKKAQPDAIRILLTGYTDLESVINAINKGQIYRYITKPWDPEELKGLVQQAIEVFEMKHTITSQNEELIKANEQLKSLDQLKSEFMMLVNHELKTPLTGIFSYTQLLGEEKLTREQQSYVDRIIKNTKRLEDLIEDTLLITRMKTQKEKDEKVELVVTEIIENHWNQLSSEYVDKSLTLNLESSQPFALQIYEKYLRILIKKLLENCFVHAKNASTVTISVRDNDQQWIIFSENEMNQELNKNAADLVSAFSKGSDILNHSGGPGLGLAVIQSIVSLFNGQMELNTEDNNFQVTLTIPK